jgi:hypothetical protein
MIWVAREKARAGEKAVGRLRENRIYESVKSMRSVDETQCSSSDREVSPEPSYLVVNGNSAAKN